MKKLTQMYKGYMFHPILYKTVTRTSIVAVLMLLWDRYVSDGYFTMWQAPGLLLGVGLLIQQSLWLFNLIKLAGAAYLIFLGIKMLRAKPATDEVLADQPALSRLGALRTGFLTNVLNPKTTIFIVSLFMQVVQPQTPLAVQIGYGAFIALAHALWFGAVALFFSTPAVRDRLLAVRHWIDRVFGGLLVGFGMLLALTQQSR